MGHEQEQGKPANEATATNKNEAKLERRRKRWAIVNKNRPASENPFLSAIKPDHENYGEPDESAEDLRARLASLEFGNYPGYFNYRNKTSEKTAGQQSASNPLDYGLTDERLRLMKAEWFNDKSVLDVGCNRGHITYAIAKLFSPKFILGIDVDLKMIHMANRDLHLHLEDDLTKANVEFRVERAHKLCEHLEENLSEEPTHTAADDQKDQPQQESALGECARQYTEDKAGHFTLSSYVAQGPLASSIPRSTKTDCVNSSNDAQEQTTSTATNSPHDEATNGTEPDELPSRAGSFPNNILFVEHNYVLSKDELVDRQKAFFDTIVCLSVTKWIHLNYRDAGLKRFFRRMYNHLHEGGVLVLEVQPFDNYHRKKKLSDRLRSNFDSIRFKPDQFNEFLLSEEVGFKKIIYSTKTQHECEGFRRPLEVFLK